MTKEVMVLGFKQEYRFLSNFHIEPDGTCVEVEYQAAKCVDKREAAKLLRMHPSDAKQAGKKVKLRPDWDTARIGVMADLVERKFRDHAELRDKLIATGDAYLEETNYWGDTFWGVWNGEGENWLGQILMTVRDKL